VPAPAPAPAPLLTAGFEEGLLGWNIAGVGDVVPTVVTDIVRSGTHSARVALSGTQERSELILGGDGGSSINGIVKLNYGDTRYFAFSVDVLQMQYGRPGAHNLIMQLKSDNEGSPRLGLMLWDYAGDDGHSGGRGLWSHGEAMGGDRFLAQFPERQWHDLIVGVHVSSSGDGWYRVYLDNRLVDERNGANVLRSGAQSGYLKVGLYRNGAEIPGPSELRFDSARLGTSLESVASG
jgi:hypothetical protein